MAIYGHLYGHISHEGTSRGLREVLRKQIKAVQLFYRSKPLPIGKSSKNIKIRIFPLKVKNTGIVRILYSYYGPPPLANFPFKIHLKTARMERPW